MTNFQKINKLLSQDEFIIFFSKILLLEHFYNDNTIQSLIKNSDESLNQEQIKLNQIYKLLLNNNINSYCFVDKIENMKEQKDDELIFSLVEIKQILNNTRELNKKKLNNKNFEISSIQTLILKVYTNINFNEILNIFHNVLNKQQFNKVLSQYLNEVSKLMANQQKFEILYLFCKKQNINLKFMMFMMTSSNNLDVIDRNSKIMENIINQSRTFNKFFQNINFYDFYLEFYEFFYHIFTKHQNCEIKTYYDGYNRLIRLNDFAFNLFKKKQISFEEYSILVDDFQILSIKMTERHEQYEIDTERNSQKCIDYYKENCMILYHKLSMNRKEYNQKIQLKKQQIQNKKIIKKMLKSNYFVEPTNELLI